MCGITAIASIRPLEDHTNIIAATERLKHRGPDDHGFKYFEHCHLGHRRLSVIDLAGGIQPMSTQDGRSWIVFNGEIYNYRELKKTLQSVGYIFNTNSDTEVILHAYEHYGEEVSKYLNGQFAFVIWNIETQEMFATRDRMGEKPLYYAHLPNGDIVVASEIKAILATQMLQPKLDLLSVDAYLGLLYVPPHRTIYKNVSTLQPASSLKWSDGRLTTWRYWSPKFGSNETISLNDAIDRLTKLISQAVERQMVSDVPLGAFLSGGLDSSTIVAYMTQFSSKPVLTFAVGFGDLINELPYARVVAQKYNTLHHEIQMDIAVGDLLQEMCHVYDEPFADSSNIPTYLISKFARQHVTVALSGDGGDELFGGYPWYIPLLNPRNKLQAAKTALLSGVQWLISKSNRAQAVRDARMALIQLKHHDSWQQHIEFSTLMKHRNRVWVSSDYKQSYLDLQRYYQDNSLPNSVDRAVDFDLRCYMPGDILTKVDRAAMANGLETRAPFLDVDLVEFVLSLPANLRFGSSVVKESDLKGLLRRSSAQLWPPEVQSRNKQGFGAPIHKWLLRPELQELINRVTTQSAPLTSLIPTASHIFASANSQMKWTLLCLGLWLEAHPT